MKNTKDRLIPKMICTLAVASMLCCAGIAVDAWDKTQQLNVQADEVASQKQQILDNFANSPTFQNIYANQMDSAGYRLATRDINQLDYGSEVAHIQSESYVKEMFFETASEEEIRLFKAIEKKQSKISSRNMWQLFKFYASIIGFTSIPIAKFKQLVAKRKEKYKVNYNSSCFTNKSL